MKYFLYNKYVPKFTSCHVFVRPLVLLYSYNIMAPSAVDMKMINSC